MALTAFGFATTATRRGPSVHPARGFRPGLETKEFGPFLPFIQVANPDRRERFTGILGTLHAVSGSEWRPGNCHAAGVLGCWVLTLMDHTAIPDLDVAVKEFDPPDERGCHFFLTLTLPGEPELVVDPFGIPAPAMGSDDLIPAVENSALHPRLNVPFFGEADHALPLHRTIYELAEPVEFLGQPTSITDVVAGIMNQDNPIKNQ